MRNRNNVYILERTVGNYFGSLKSVVIASYEFAKKGIPVCIIGSMALDITDNLYEFLGGESPLDTNILLYGLNIRVVGNWDMVYQKIESFFGGNNGLVIGRLTDIKDIILNLGNDTAIRNFIAVNNIFRNGTISAADSIIYGLLQPTLVCRRNDMYEPKDNSSDIEKMVYGVIKDIMPGNKNTVSGY